MQLDGGKLTPGTTISLQLDPEQRGKGVRVTPNWVGGVNPYFLSYRGTTGAAAGGVVRGEGTCAMG